MDETRQKTMQPESRERLPNWSPIMDLDIAQPTGAPGVPSSNRPSIYITSGRQPHGAVNELRIGCEAKVSLEADLSVADELYGAYRLWALPDPFDSRSTYVFLTYPGATTTWHFSSDEEVTAVDIQAECHSATLLAKLLHGNIMLQVTETSLTALLFLADDGNPVAKVTAQIPNGSTVVAADHDDQSSAIVVALRTDSHVFLQLYSLDEAGLFTTIAAPFQFPAYADLTCLCLFRAHGKLFTLAGLRDGSLHLFGVHMLLGISTVATHSIGATTSTQSLPITESVTVLRTDDDEPTPSNHLVTCGLRDGNLYTVELDLTGGQFSKCDEIISLHAILTTTQTGVMIKSSTWVTARLASIAMGPRRLLALLFAVMTRVDSVMRRLALPSPASGSRITVDQTTSNQPFQRSVHYYPTIRITLFSPALMAQLSDLPRSTAQHVWSHASYLSNVIRQFQRLKKTQTCFKMTLVHLSDCSTRHVSMP
jgi:hypothetical protein